MHSFKLTEESKEAFEAYRKENYEAIYDALSRKEADVFDDMKDSSYELLRINQSLEIISELFEEKILEHPFILSKPDLFHQAYLLYIMLSEYHNHIDVLWQNYDDDAPVMDFTDTQE